MLVPHITAYLLGAVSGFLASVPLGPIGILCMQRTLSNGRTNGFVSGMGAATADTVFATLALFCLTYINAFLDQYNFWVKVTGGIILLIFGYSIYQKRVPRSSITGNGTSSKNYLSNFFSVLVLTLTNPAYFLVYAMIFAALGMGGTRYSLSSDILLLLGVLTGTSGWWFTLSLLISKLRHRMTYRRLVILNKTAGIVIAAFGILAIVTVVIKLIPPFGLIHSIQQ